MDNYRHREQPQSIGVGVLLVPLLVMALVLKFSMNQFGVPYGDRAQPPPAQGEARVPGFGGALDTSAGRLLVRLAPLHSDPVRQRFDTLALGERFATVWRSSLFSSRSGPVRTARSTRSRCCSRRRPAGCSPEKRSVSCSGAASPERARRSMESAALTRSTCEKPAFRTKSSCARSRDSIANVTRRASAPTWRSADGLSQPLLRRWDSRRLVRR